MSIAVCHGGDPIPKSPFHINVAPLLDLSKVSIQGLNSSEYIHDHKACFIFELLVLPSKMSENPTYAL